MQVYCTEVMTLLITQGVNAFIGARCGTVYRSFDYTVQRGGEEVGVYLL